MQSAKVNSPSLLLNIFKYLVFNTPVNSAKTHLWPGEVRDGDVLYVAADDAGAGGQWPLCHCGLRLHGGQASGDESVEFHSNKWSDLQSWATLQFAIFTNCCIGLAKLDSLLVSQIDDNVLPSFQISKRFLYKMIYERKKYGWGAGG